MGHVPKGFSVGGVVRTADEEHRAATPLELLFDLCFVVAVAQAAAGLHELLLDRRFADGVVGFLSAFFSVWWAWVNVVWFATGHDSDDVIHRLMTLVQMAGALILAAGVHSAMTDLDFTTSTIGYVVMRLGIVPLWIRVGRDHPAQRERCYRYAATIVIVQTYWVLRLALPDGKTVALTSLTVGVLIELSAPIWAERKAVVQNFHGGHLAERFGLFTIIVLGEGILSSTMAVEQAIDASGVSFDLLFVAGAGLVITFAVWWGYFGRNDEPEFDRFNGAFIWGYGHFPVFGGLAAFGGGMLVAIGAVTGHGGHTPSERVAALAVTVPFAVGAAGFAWILWKTGDREERSFSRLLLGAAVSVAMLGAFGSIKVAMMGTAVVFVSAATAQGFSVNRRMAVSRS